MSDTIFSFGFKKLVRFAVFFALFCGLSAFKFNSKPVAPAEKMAEIQQLREYVAGYAQNFTGLKYRRAGQSPRTGFDCSGFTSYILKEFGVNVSASSATQSQQGIQISLDAAQTGDLLFFGRRGHIQHVALIVEKTDEGFVCVHSTSSRGIVVENVSQSDYWKSRLLFARDVILPAKLSE